MKTHPRVLVFPTALGWTSLAVDGRFVSRLSFGHATPREAVASCSSCDDELATVAGAELAAIDVVLTNTLCRPAMPRSSRTGASPRNARFTGGGASRAALPQPPDISPTIDRALADVHNGGEPADDHGDFADLVWRLQKYAEGAEDDFLDVELAPSEQTLFQQRVVELCRRIPFGSSLTYGELAERAGHPRAARAVGNCMRTNPVPLIVPCHRVVGAGGAMRGYSAGEGVRMKLRLLEMEAAACGAA